MSDRSRGKSQQIEEIALHATEDGSGHFLLCSGVGTIWLNQEMLGMAARKHTNNGKANAA